LCPSRTPFPVHRLRHGPAIARSRTRQDACACGRRGHRQEGTIEIDMDKILRAILTSRVYEVARETSLDVAPRLSKRLENTVWLKREDQQPVFSFKIRG